MSKYYLTKLEEEDTSNYFLVEMTVEDIAVLQE